MMLPKKRYFFTVSLLALFSGLLCLLPGCEKEEVNEPLVYDDLTSIVGTGGKKVRFFSNYSEIPDELFPQLSFPENSFNEDTRVTLEYKELLKTQLPDSLVTVNSDCRYLWFFSAEEKVILMPVQVTIPYPDNLGEKLLQNYEYLFKLYRIRRGASTRLPGNLEMVQDYELDTVNNRIRFVISAFDYGYTILFQEIRRRDHVIIHAQDDLFRIFDNNMLTQHLFELDAYYSPEYLHGKGFRLAGDTSFYELQGFHGYSSTIRFSFPGHETGTFTGDQISVSFNSYRNYSGEYVINFRESGSTSIRIDEFGEIGGFVEGTISGELFETYYIRYIDFHIYFRIRRLR